MTTEPLERGRYLISIDAVEKGDPGAVVFHDTYHLDERCNTDEIKRRSYFHSREWAEDKGYRPCAHCADAPEQRTPAA